MYEFGASGADKKKKRKMAELKMLWLGVTKSGG